MEFHVLPLQYSAWEDAVDLGPLGRLVTEQQHILDKAKYRGCMAGGHHIASPENILSYSVGT